MLIVESGSMDVYQNLAIEEYLMNEVRDCGPILFLWQSDCAVVMGKNQNPWKECRLGRMRDEGVPAARRVSGGGTVYHDAGNLNYCVIVEREKYQEEQAYELVFRALESFGIQAEKTGKSNLSVNGLKFSGNAFAFRNGRAMHHGTLLLKTDLKRLCRYLGSMIDGIQTNAIVSVPADVANLDLEVAAVKLALREQFVQLYAAGECKELQGEDLDQDALGLMKARQVSDEWIYDTTPRFSLDVNGETWAVVKGHVVDGASAGKAFRDLAFSLFCPID